MALKDEDIDKINFQSGGKRNVEIVFKSVPDDEDMPSKEDALHPSLLLHDVHHAVKAYQNAKVGG